MSVRIEQSALNDALKMIMPVVSRSGQLPIFSAVRLILGGGSGSAIATDGDMSVFAYINGETTLDGLDVVVPARHLAAIVGGCRGIVELAVEDDQLVVSNGNDTYTLRTMFVDDFPKIATAEGEAVLLNAAAKERLGRILFAASRDNARPILQGVGIGDGWAACTDSFRLAAVEVGGLPTAIIPARAFELVFKHSTGDVAITVDDRRATFATVQGSWTVRLIEGTFPNWRQLVPAETAHVLIIERDTLIDGISRASALVTNDEPIRLERCDDGLRLSVQVRDVGDSGIVLPAEVDFENPIGFNARFLSDMLKACNEGKIDIGIVDQSKPACIGSLADGAVALCMPVRIA